MDKFYNDRDLQLYTELIRSSKNLKEFWSSDKKKASIGGKTIDLNFIRTGNNGLFIKGKKYLIIEPKDNTWSIRKKYGRKVTGSSVTFTNRKQFIKYIKPLTEAGDAEQADERYIELNKDIGISEEISKFLLMIANHQTILDKTKKIIDSHKLKKEGYENDGWAGVFAFDETPSQKRATAATAAKAEAGEQIEAPKMGGKTGEEVMSTKKNVRGRKLSPEEEAENMSKEDKAKAEREIPIEVRPRDFDQDDEKYKRVLEGGQPAERMEGIEMIKGKVLRVNLLKKGEFGYVFRGSIFPMFKVDFLASGSNSWSFVEGLMLPQEKELFKRMSKLDDESAFELYKEYYTSDEYRIPAEVVARALDVANNEQTQSLIRGIVRNFGSDDSAEDFLNNEGFNISNYEPDNTIIETFMGWVEIMSKGNRADTTKAKFKAKRTEQADKLADEEFKTMSKTESEIKEMFSKFKQGTPLNKGQDSNNDMRISDQETKQAVQDIEDEIEENQPPAPGMDPDAPVQGPIITDLIRRQEAEKNIQYIQPTAEDMDKLNEQMMTSANYSQDIEMFEQKDRVPDISKFGHQKSVSRIAKARGIDFTLMLNKVRFSSDAPSKDYKTRKVYTDICLMEYGEILFIEGLTSDYNYEECLELETLKRIYNDSISEKRQARKSMIKLYQLLADNITNNDNNTNIMEGMTSGFILNTEMMNINPSDLVGQINKNKSQPVPPVPGSTPGTVPGAPVPPVPPSQPVEKPTVKRQTRQKAKLKKQTRQRSRRFNPKINNVKFKFKRQRLQQELYVNLGKQNPPDPVSLDELNFKFKK